MPSFAQSSIAANPALGVLMFAIGGLAGAVFYLPFRKVKGWAWESYWFLFAVFGLLVVPWLLALATSPNVISVLKAAPGKELGYCFVCGAMWGLGGLTWGLMLRYLGMGLGLAIGCGLCSASGTLIPPIVKPILQTFVSVAPGDASLTQAIQRGLQSLHGSPSANASLLGVLISLIGIVFVGGAGMSKEQELPEEVKKATVAEYNFRLGLIVALFSGLMSGAINLGLQGGESIGKLARTVDPSQQYLARSPRVGRGAVGRVCRQCLVPVPECQPHHRQLRERHVAAGRQLHLCWTGRGHLVLSVHLPQDGRTGNGGHVLRRLLGADGEHHPVQHGDRHRAG